MQEDEHLLTVLRYVERNPLRADLVAWAEEWRWSSLGHRREPERGPWLHPGPVPRGLPWLAHVKQPQTEAELERLRRSVRRGVPYGGGEWGREAAARLGLESTLRPAQGAARARGGAATRSNRGASGRRDKPRMSRFPDVPVSAGFRVHTQRLWPSRGHVLTTSGYGVPIGLDAG